MTLKSHISYFLLVCFSVIQAHNLVPHHHHAEILQSPVTRDCPFEHTDHHEHDHCQDSDADRHPLHCHAFNDVFFELTKIRLINQENVQVPGLFLPGQLELAEVTFSLSSSSFTPFKFSCKAYTDLETRSLRGPPAFV